MESNNSKDIKYEYNEISFANGNIYRGDLKVINGNEAIMHGKGYLMFPNGDLYIGDFKEDLLVSGIKFSSDDTSEHVKMWYGNFVEGSLKDKDGIIIEEGNKIFSGKVENDEILSGIMVSTKKDSSEPEYVYSLTKNEGAFEFEAGVDEEKKGRLLEIIKEYLPIKPNEDIITPFIELKEKILEILKSKDFIEISDVETIQKEIDNYIKSVNEEKLGKLKALLVKK